MQCDYYEQGVCRSCSLCPLSYDVQIQQKDQALKHLLAEHAPQDWRSPVMSAQTGFRNKAKMVVLGAAHAPILGIESAKDGSPVSLTHCPLYPTQTQQLLTYLEQWIRVAGIAPYHRLKKKGELKFILLTRSESTGQFMLRFVAKSRAILPRLQQNLAQLQAAFPEIRVISLNIQPIAMARLEGEEELFLTDEQQLIEQLNDVPMVLRPKSFFQTNPQVAQQLYATARAWVREIAPTHMWDLFCGVGGFALHCASPSTLVTGIEIEPEAIASAMQSAKQMQLTQYIHFAALDSAQFSVAQTQAPGLVLVNPPRRGLGAQLVEQLEALAPEYVLYSSCNPQTLVQDLTLLTHYQTMKLQWFDMFAHTQHLEVLVLLKRK